MLSPRWVSFPAVTGYFVKMAISMKGHLQKTFAPLDNSLQCCMVKQVSTYTNIDMGRKHLFTKKFVDDEMPALSKVALYQHILKAAYQSSCVWVSARAGEMITKFSKL